MSTQSVSAPDSEPKQHALSSAEEGHLAVAAEHAALTGRLLLPNVFAAQDVLLSDVAQHVESFAAQVEEFAIDNRYLSVAIGNTIVPVDIRGSLGIEAQYRTLRLPDSAAEKDRKIRGAYELLRTANLNPEIVPLPQVRSFFAQGLAEVLGRRIGSARGLFGSFGMTVGTAAVPGLNVRVQTHTVGIKILYSPALFFNANNAFGNSLSSPVDSYLAPGIYYFGGTGLPLGGTQWETAREHIPPTSVVNTALI
jgi:hypothetical protein